MKLYPLILAMLFCFCNISFGIGSESDSETESIDWDVSLESSDGGSGGAESSVSAVSRARLPIGRSAGAGFSREIELDDSIGSGGSWGADFGGAVITGQLAALARAQKDVQIAAAVVENVKAIMLELRPEADPDVIKGAIPFRHLIATYPIEGTAFQEGIPTMKVMFDTEHSFQDLADEFSELPMVIKVHRPEQGAELVKRLMREGQERFRFEKSYRETNQRRQQQ